MKRLWRVSVLVLGVGLLAFAQTAEKKVAIKKVPIRPTSMASGPEMYVQYCAACHGRRGRGDGPAVPALKSVPSDLTTLSARNKGEFPMAKVQAVLLHQTDVAAHGTTDMPVWGPLLSSIASGEAEIQLRVRNIADYIKSMQRN